jgi:hypothetical protein
MQVGVPRRRSSGSAPPSSLPADRSYTGGSAIVGTARFRPADRLRKLRRTAATLSCESKCPAGEAPARLRRPPSRRPELHRRFGHRGGGEIPPRRPAPQAAPDCCPPSHASRGASPEKLRLGSAVLPPRRPELHRRFGHRGGGEIPPRRPAPQAAPDCYPPSHASRSARQRSSGSAPPSFLSGQDDQAEPRDQGKEGKQRQHPGHVMAEALGFLGLASLGRHTIPQFQIPATGAVHGQGVRQGEGARGDLAVNRRTAEPHTIDDVLKSEVSASVRARPQPLLWEAIPRPPLVSWCGPGGPVENRERASGMCYAAAPLRTYQLARIRGFAAQAGKTSLSDALAAHRRPSPGMSTFSRKAHYCSLYIARKTTIDMHLNGF